MPSLLDRLSRLGARSGEDSDARIQRATLVLGAVVVAILATVWTVAYALLGILSASAVPLTYQVATGIGLVLLARTRQVERFRRLQLGLMLGLPFALEWILGGFANASAVGLWGLVTAFGAVYVLDARRAVPWFALFLALVGVSGLLEPSLAARAPSLPEFVRTAFFVLNIGGVSVVTYLLLQYFVRQREDARQSTERLLLALLPAPIADQLKAGVPLIAERHEDVTVLFADIVDFTPFAAQATPAELVRMLDRIFTAFDGLADRHGLEKIKTIGDVYMVVGGAPVAHPDHTAAMAEMALDMLAESERCTDEGMPVRLRIGIDRGPVVAGVIGRQKFIYDLWGDTVNTASRMESQGVPGGIQVTAAVEATVRDRFVLEPRGRIAVKGKGEMATWLLVGRA